MKYWGGGRGWKDKKGGGVCVGIIEKSTGEVERQKERETEKEIEIAWLGS